MIRRLSLVLATLATTATTTAVSVSPAAAGEPLSLADLMAEVSRSMDEVTRSQLEVVRAEKAYDDQLEVVRAAAVDLLDIFADDATEVTEAPTPSKLFFVPAWQPRPGSRLAALLDFTPAPAPAPKRLPVPATSRLRSLLDVDPNGTSIYDSLTFNK